MNAFDPAGQEFLRISEHYRQLSDEEILVLMPQSSELTTFAQHALANEVRQRGLKAEVEEAEPVSPAQVIGSQIKPPPAFFEHESRKLRNSADYGFPDADSSYDEDRKLVELCTVWSVRDALQVQSLLDAPGIPFFMGPEKATGVDAVTSDFSKGVLVQIMHIGLPWAGPAMRYFEPKDDPTPKQEEESKDILVRCPRCHSTDVVFDDQQSESEPGKPIDDASQKFSWSCDACGHHWEDDGVAEEK